MHFIALVEVGGTVVGMTGTCPLSSFVFKDKKLQKYFSRFWWYMPDPSWKPSTDDFTPREWKLINQGE